MFKLPSPKRMDTSTTSNGTMMTEEELEPYVRRKRADGASRKKMEGLNEQEQNLLRNSINSRERRRMHELNEEFEALRECIPYSNDANTRRMSKSNTLLLASNWIKHLEAANKRLQIELNMAKAQITALVSLKTDVSTPSPTSNESSTTSSTSSSKCTKCNQHACFSVSCLTSS